MFQESFTLLIFTESTASPVGFVGGPWALPLFNGGVRGGRSGSLHAPTRAGRRADRPVKAWELAHHDPERPPRTPPFKRGIDHRPLHLDCEVEWFFVCQKAGCDQYTVL